MLSNLKIALVHDWLNQIGGAENVLEELVDLFPNAPIYTSMYAPEKMPSKYRSWNIHTSFMQRLPGILEHHQPYLPIYPLAFQRTTLSDYDLVLSNKSGFCHGVVTAAARSGNLPLAESTGFSSNGASCPNESSLNRSSLNRSSLNRSSLNRSSLNRSSLNGAAPNGFAATQPNPLSYADRKTLHVCYCLTPTRFLWLYEQYKERENIGGVTNIALQPFLSLLRWWDRQAAQRVDHFIAISTEVQQRIKQIYSRDSVVIHPPVDTNYFWPLTNPGEGDYFLSIGRLIPYKRVDLAVDAFAHLPDQKLIVVGDGRDYAALAERATPNVTFLGRQSRDKIRELLQHCKAFVFPGREDFGIAPVEALSTGRPVIAFKGGGALDTIKPGVTGEYFTEPTVESLVEVLQNFDSASYSPVDCRAQAELFSTESFRYKLTDYLEDVLNGIPSQAVSV